MLTMAVVEEPAALTGLEPCRSLTDTDLTDMKNTARKSTAKLAQVLLIEKCATSPVAITNGIIENHVANGNGLTHKRSVEPEVGNPAKVARLHIETMEKAQEEMTRKLSREEVVPQNGEGGESNDSYDSKHSQNSKTSLVLTADVKNNFKGILDVAMNKIGSRRRSSNESHSSITKEDSTNQPSSEQSQQQNSDLDDVVIEIAEDNPGKTTENTCENASDNSNNDPKNITNETETSDDLSLERPEVAEKTNVAVTNDVTEKSDTVVNTNNNTDEQNAAAEKESAITENKDVTENNDSVISEETNDKILSGKEFEEKCEDRTEKGDEKTLEQPSEAAKDTSDVESNEVSQAEDVLLGTDGDIEGDVDDAVLLSDEDANDDKADKGKEITHGEDGENGGKDKDSETGSVENCDSMVKNQELSTQTFDVSSEESKKAEDVESTKEINTAKDAVEKSELAITEPAKSKPESKSDEPELIDSIDLVSPEKNSIESDSAKLVDSTESAKKDEDDSDSVKVAAVNVKGIDVPADSIINLDDDEDNSQGPDNPIEIEDDIEIDNKSETSDASRKRSATSPVPSNASSGTKKSRLDKVIGRLGTAIGMKSGEMSGDDVKVINDVNPDDVGAGEKSIKTDALEGNKNGTDIKADTSMGKDDLKPKAVINKENIITAAASEINGLLVTRMNAYFNRTRDSIIVQYQRQIGELQAAVESWRAQAKRLAKQLDEQRLAQSRNPRKKRRANSEDSPKNVQLQAASIQQQGGGGKVVARQAPRTPPRTPGMGPAVSVKHTAAGPQIRPMTAAQAAQAAAQGKTVRDLLDKQRSGESGNAPNKVLIQGGRIMTSGAQIVQRGGTLVSRAPGTGTAIRSVHPTGKSVIDLTDDDDRRTGPTTAGRMVRGPTPTGGAVRGPAPGDAGRQGAVLVQQMPTNSGPVIVQQVMTSQSVRPSPGTAYVYTTRPGTLSMQTAPGTSLVRPAVITSAAPPALRPASQAVTVARMPGPASSSLTRPPPPLRSAPNANAQAKHPAPLPTQPEKQSVQAKMPPPKPGLKISRVQSGIVLSWNMTISDSAASISSYQLFAYQETSAAPATSLWKKVGDVKALPLPMACTLTQFQEGNKYHFAVRAVDAHSRVGPFSDPSSIALTVINVS